MEDAASLMGEFVPELVRHAQGLDNSPITGPEGNIEFMCDMVPGAEGSLEVGALPELVARMPRLTGAGDGGRGGGGQSYTQKMARAECPVVCAPNAWPSGAHTGAGTAMRACAPARVCGKPGRVQAVIRINSAPAG